MNQRLGQFAFNVACGALLDATDMLLLDLIQQVQRAPAEDLPALRTALREAVQHEWVREMEADVPP